MAFCPNALCDRNERSRAADGSLRIVFKSSESYPGSKFDEINFCARCGEELVKECPSCKRRIRTKGARFCVTCGAQVSNRPTQAEWEEVAKMLPPEPPNDDDDDLPF